MLSNSSISVLQNVLRPETVMALENVPFVQRAQALPGVIDASYSLDEVLYTGENPDEEMIDAKGCMRIQADTEERMMVMDRHIIVGGLAYDSDSEHLNPCVEGTANGNIFNASTRRGTAEEQGSFYEALGLDGDGNKDFSCQSVKDRLVKRVMKGICNNLGIFSRLLHRLRATGRKVSKASLQEVVEFAINQEGPEYALDYLADSLYGVPYWNRLDGKLQDVLEPLADLFTESAVEACWDEACSAGELGNPFAVELDIYEHGGVAYSISGTGMQCRWDTSRCAAVWVPDDDALDNITSNVLSALGIGKIQWFGACGSDTDPLHARYSLDGETWIGEGMGWKWREALNQMTQAAGLKDCPEKLNSLMYAEAKRYCQSVIEDYNNWVNGNAYGVVFYVIDRKTGERVEEHDDECWGYLGSDYAEEELESSMLAKAIELGQTLH